MVKKKTRQQSGGRSVFHLPETNPYDSKRKSEPAWLWDEIRKGKFSPDKLTLMGEDGSMAITMLLKAFGIISSPMHPDNNWRSVVEKMAIGKDVYYRLATEIPIPAMEYWKKHGHPPKHGWDFFDPNASLGGKSPRQPQPAPKPPAKKAKKSSARKPLSEGQVADQLGDLFTARYISDNP